MTQEGNVITAETGKVFRRIADQTIYGETIALGYTYYINGELLSEPHLDIPEDFEEIDKPEEPTRDLTEQPVEE